MPDRSNRKTDADEYQERCRRTHDELRHWCQQNNVTVTVDGRVSEKIAAKITGYSDEYFVSLRRIGTGPAWYRFSAGDGRFSYRLFDIASWIEKQRQESAL